MSMQDSKIALTTCAAGRARREPVMNRTTTIRVSCSAYACHPIFLPSPPSLSPSAPVYGFVLRKLLHFGDPRQPLFLLFRNRILACVLPSQAGHPSCDLPAYNPHSCATCFGRRASTPILSLFILAHVPLQAISRLQCYIYRLSVEWEFLNCA